MLDIREILAQWQKQNKDIWIDIPNYVGYYKMNIWGHIKSLDRIIIKGNGRKCFIKGRIMKPFLKKRHNDSQYYEISLRKNRKRKCFKIHMLVYLTWFDKTHDGKKALKMGYSIDHINKISTDNNPLNLRLLSCSEQTKQGYTAERKKAKKHLTELQLKIIRVGYECGISQLQIARMLDICEATVNRTVNGKYYN